MILHILVHIVYVYNIAVYISFCVLLNCCHISPKLPYQGSETLAHVYQREKHDRKKGEIPNVEEANS